MKLLFTKNNLPLSKLIRWGFAEPCSHFAIAFDNRVVFHSNLKGPHVEWLSSFLKQSTIVESIDLKLTLEMEEAIYQKCIAVDGKHYDFGAFIFLCIDLILFKLFKLPLKKTNLFASKDSFLCTELSSCISPAVDLSLIGELDTISPHQLYLKLRGLIQ